VAGVTAAVISRRREDCKLARGNAGERKKLRSGTSTYPGDEVESLLEYTACSKVDVDGGSTHL
jgi:hypothetical protein